MNAVFIGMAGIMFAADEVLKQAVEETLVVGEERKLRGGKIMLRRVHNQGMALNLLEQYPKAVMKGTSAVGILLLVNDGILLCRKGRRLSKTGMMLLTGGAASNLFDRLVRGKVVDYFGFCTGVEKFDQVTFNMGDLFIVAGAVISAAGSMMKK